MDKPPACPPRPRGRTEPEEADICRATKTGQLNSLSTTIVAEGILRFLAPVPAIMTTAPALESGPRPAPRSLTCGGAQRDRCTKVRAIPRWGYPIQMWARGHRDREWNVG